MRLAKLILENFRAYRKATTIEFNDLTVIIGKNDVGKSSVLEALDIFFENRKPDQHDCNKEALHNGECIVLTVAFSDLPARIDLDAGAETDLASEYLLGVDGLLYVQKRFVSISRAPEIYIIANHPANEGYAELHSLKQPALRELVKDESGVDKRVNNEMRKALWQRLGSDLELQEQAISIKQEGLKDLWEKIRKQLPLYALFQADRSNLDKDSEIQDPLKFATKQVIGKLEKELTRIRDIVQQEVTTVAKHTIEKLREMNPEIASQLSPSVQETAWDKIFNISINTGEIPLNKRGSGVRRLILINFFRQEAERRQLEGDHQHVIYAVEEPETSQHPTWQEMLFDALAQVSQRENTQVLITTHSPRLASKVSKDNLRFIFNLEGINYIQTGNEENFRIIADTLGVGPLLSDKLHKVKVIVCVEGPTDVAFLLHISSIFGLNLAENPRFVVIPLGGQTLQQWVTHNYLAKLGLPEFHLYDRDKDAYTVAMERVNSRPDKSSAFITNCYEIENYVHPSLIASLYRHTNQWFNTAEPGWQASWKNLDIPKELHRHLKKCVEDGMLIRDYGEGSIKNRIAAECAPQMTEEHLRDLGVYDEIHTWLKALQDMAG